MADLLLRPQDITACLLVIGASEYFLRIWVAEIEALRALITNASQGIPAVAGSAQA